MSEVSGRTSFLSTCMRKLGVPHHPWACTEMLCPHLLMSMQIPSLFLSGHTKYFLSIWLKATYLMTWPHISEHNTFNMCHLNIRISSKRKTHFLSLFQIKRQSYLLFIKNREDRNFYLLRTQTYRLGPV